MIRGAFHAGAVAVVISIGVLGSAGCGDEPAVAEIKPVVTAYNSAVYKTDRQTNDLRAPDNMTGDIAGGFVVTYDKHQSAD